jgi:uncharacterized protein (TIGR00730 family)
MTTIEKVAVYLGSSGRCRQVFKDTAAAMGRLIGQSAKTLVYGGMDSGLMGIVANHALQNGAKVTGIIPKSLKDSERIHPKLTETILVQDLWERKRKMFRRADAVIVLAGGFGTADEALEVFYWAKLGSHTKPVAFVNTENYWDDFLEYLRAIPDLNQEYLLIAATPEDALEKLAAWRGLAVNGDPENLPHFEDDILKNTLEPLIIDTADIRQSYIFATAVGLKQLGRHERPIGLYNKDGQFDTLVRWITLAQKEHFITDHCTKLFSVDSDLDTLKKKLMLQGHVDINLAVDKWGPSETKTHIEIRETR